MPYGRQPKQPGQRMTAEEYNALLASSERIDRADDHEFALRNQFPYSSTAPLDDRLTSPDNIQEWRYAVIVETPPPDRYGTPAAPVEPPELVGAQYWVEEVREVSPTVINTTEGTPKPDRSSGEGRGRGRGPTPTPGNFRSDTMLDPLEFKTLNDIIFDSFDVGGPGQQSFQYKYFVATNINELDFDDVEGGTSNIPIGTVIKLLVMRKPDGIGKFYFWGGGGGSSAQLAVVVGNDDPGSQFVHVCAVEKVAPEDEGGNITWKFSGTAQPVLCWPPLRAEDYKWFRWQGAEVAPQTIIIRVIQMGGDWYAERIYPDIVMPQTELQISDCRWPEGA